MKAYSLLIFIMLFISCKEQSNTASENESLVFGLTEAERISIYNEFDLASKQAADDAEKYYPNDIKDRISKGIGNRVENDKLFELGTQRYMKVNDSLHQYYYGELALKHHLSNEQLDSIAIEGLTKHWPSIFD